MGESACLVRSLSHPSDSSSKAKKEGDPICALGESISFGRFMSESLAWEKWSSFSHNRYLEEVEKFSKPGSVAQKKAYFEAHYKKKAAEKAAESIVESNALTRNEFESETEDKHHGDSLMNPELMKVGHKSIEEQCKDDALNSTLYSSPAGNGSNPNIGKMETDKLEGDEEVIRKRVYVVKDPSVVENAERTEKIEDYQKMLVTREEKKLNEKAPSKQILASPSQRRQVDSTLKLSTQSTASKLPVSPVRGMTSRQIQNGNNGAAECKRRTGEEPVGKKRLTVKSVHVSINFASRTGKSSSKTTSTIQEVGSTRNDIDLCSTSQESSTPLRTSTVESVNKIINQRSVEPWSEDRSFRNRTVLNKSVSGRIAGDAKGHFLSMDCTRSSPASGSKARSSTVFSPFTFRSEERAAKRKQQFLLKLEAKEAEKLQLQSQPKEKAQPEIEKLQKRPDFRAKQNEDSNRGSQLPSSPLKKKSVSHPRSPKLGRNQALSTARSRPPRWPAARNDSFKDVTEKVNPTTIRSITSLPKKTVHENASPNIQQ